MSLWKPHVVWHLREAELRGTTENAQARPWGIGSRDRRPRRGLHAGRRAPGLLCETETPRLVLQVRSLTANRLTVNPKMLQAGDKQ